MMNNNLIEPKEIDIDGKKFIISKFPAVQGREIIANYPLTGMPKKNEEIMLKLMSYVAVPLESGHMTLGNEKAINSQISSWEILMKLEIEMMEYNCSFFQRGQILNLLKSFAQNIVQPNSKTSTDSSELLSPLIKPPSTN